MAAKVQISPIQLPVPGLREMQTEAREEGHQFLERLLHEWVSGENRYDGTGEALCGHFDRDLLVAVGGLNRDPYLDDPLVGRIRRLYVRRAWRNRGIGNSLLNALLSVARENFRSVRLRAGSASAARLYERNGFGAIASPTATHVLLFDKMPTLESFRPPANR